MLFSRGPILTVLRKKERREGGERKEGRKEEKGRK
jgi:hypothetical protein